MPDKEKLRHMRNNPIHKMGPQIELLRHSLAGRRNVTFDATLDKLLYGKYWAAISSIARLPHLSPDFEALFAEAAAATCTPVIFHGTTKEHQGTMPRGLVVSMTAARDSDILVHTAISEREMKTGASPNYRLAIGIKGGLAGAVSPPAQVSRAIHSALKPLGITNISAELFTLLLLASWKSSPIYTVGVDLSANTNPNVNHQEESTLMKLLYRVKIVDQIY